MCSSDLVTRMADGNPRVVSEVHRYEKLTNENYGIWCLRTRAVLIRQRLWEAVGPGAADQDVEEEADQALSERALAEIILAVSDQFLPVIETCVSAREAWRALERMFQPKTQARQLQLRKELHNLRMRHEEEPTAYVARVRKLMNELHFAGQRIA